VNNFTTPMATFTKSRSLQNLSNRGYVTLPRKMPRLPREDAEDNEDDSDGSTAPIRSVVDDLKGYLSDSGAPSEASLDYRIAKVRAAASRRSKDTKPKELDTNDLWSRTLPGKLQREEDAFAAARQSQLTKWLNEQQQQQQQQRRREFSLPPQRSDSLSRVREYNDIFRSISRTDGDITAANYDATSNSLASRSLALDSPGLRVCEESSM
jgi:hypothetical protein